MRDDDEKVVLDRNGQAKLLHADQEIRMAQEPFPLYPGEVLKQPVSLLTVRDSGIRSVLLVLSWQEKTSNTLINMQIS